MAVAEAGFCADGRNTQRGGANPASDGAAYTGRRPARKACAARPANAQ
jgi:hypothetical protein